MGAVLVSTVWKKNRLDDRVDGYLHHNRVIPFSAL